MQSVVRRVNANCACLAAALLTLLFAGTASAQVRAALVKNVDEPGRTPYQQMVQFSTAPPTCLGGRFCLIAFNMVPAGKRLVLEQVTVYAAVVEGGQPMYLALGDNFGYNADNVAIVTPAFISSHALMGAVFWALHQPVRVYYEAGTTPKIKIAASADFTFVGNASLHGYLIDAAN